MEFLQLDSPDIPANGDTGTLEMLGRNMLILPWRLNTCAFTKTISGKLSSFVVGCQFFAETWNKVGKAAGYTHSDKEKELGV